MRAGRRVCPISVHTSPSQLGFYGLRIFGKQFVPAADRVNGMKSAEFQFCCWCCDSGGVTSELKTGPARKVFNGDPLMHAFRFEPISLEVPDGSVSNKNRFFVAACRGRSFGINMPDQVAPELPGDSDQYSSDIGTHGGRSCWASEPHRGI